MKSIDFDLFLYIRAKSDFSVATISEPIRTEEYICIHNYKATSKNELTIHKEAKCFVIEKSLNGWWFIDSSEGQGYVPQCVIQPVNYTELTDPLIIDNRRRFFIFLCFFKQFNYFGR